MVRMSPRLSAPSRPASDRFAAGAATAAVILLVVSSSLAFKYWPSDYADSPDVPLYSLYADRVADGKVPYRDFRLEYPPGALPLFVVPLAMPGARDARWAPPLNLAAHRYYRNFAALATALMAAIICLTAWSLVRLERSRRDVLTGLSVLGLSAIALGGVVYTRYDVWPAALVAAALATLLAGHTKLAALALGVGISAKLYPIVLLPLLVAFVWRRYGRRRALLALAIAAAAALAIFLPFAAIAPGAVESALRGQLERGLQVESLGSAAVLALDHIGLVSGVTVHAQAGTGTATGVDVVGSGTGTALAVLSVLRATVLLAIWISFIRGAATDDRLVRYAAAAVTASVALSPVLSPQFLVWLLPVVPLVGGRRGLAALAFLACGIVLTHVWYPYTYFGFVENLATGDVLLLLARDLTLVAVLVALVAPCARRGHVETKTVARFTRDHAEVAQA